MAKLLILSPSQQVAQQLSKELMRQTWVGLMPGAPQLAAELGVDRKTVEAALQMLQEDGWLQAQGAGKRRKIVMPHAAHSTTLRIALLANEEADRRMDYVVNLVHELNEAGHTAFYASRTLYDMGMNVKLVERLVKKTEADAWVVVAASRDVLQWFIEQSIPAFSLFGRRRGLPIAGAGPDKIPIMEEVTRELILRGHKRIVMMVRPLRRIPTPGAAERAFLLQLSQHGLPVSEYNLPSWKETPGGFQARLESMFSSAPPTALIVDEIPQLVGTLQFLARKNIRVPEDVSLVCTDNGTALDWCDPPISHIRWDTRPVLRRVVRWAANVSRGKTDIRQVLTPAEFYRGGTMATVSLKQR
jgi:DNA-binding LacI/PurR family transcriptional regulator